MVNESFAISHDNIDGQLPEWYITVILQICIAEFWHTVITLHIPACD